MIAGNKEEWSHMASNSINVMSNSKSEEKFTTLCQLLHNFKIEIFRLSLNLKILENSLYYKTDIN